MTDEAGSQAAPQQLNTVEQLGKREKTLSLVDLEV